jgi:hypothetical protein
MWTYSQSEGKIVGQESTFLGYSGAYGSVPADEGKVGFGPIVQGDYYISTPTTEKGPLSLPLTPDAATAAKISAYGRVPYNSFLIHGDNAAHPGHSSDGCIVLSEAARQAIADSKDSQLRVVA